VSLRLLTYNIRYGGVGRVELLAQVIRECRPDIAVLEEATRPEVVERLAAECQMPNWGARFGHSVAWVARVDVAASLWRGHWLAKRSYLELKTAGMLVAGVHLAAIHSNLTEQRRTWELRSILRAMPQEPHVLLGDFNSIAPGEPFELARLPRRLRAITWATGGAVRWRTIGMMPAAGYVDAYRAVHPTDPGYTFPAWDPHLRLDYCFVKNREVVACEVVSDVPGVRQASDHLPLLSVIGEPVVTP
jgi:exodeoxyribonuclease III